jgi:hypothetical protein
MNRRMRFITELERLNVAQCTGSREAAAEILICTYRGLGIHVNVQPARRSPVGANLDQVEIRGTETRADGAKVIGIAGVAAEVEAVLRAFNNP